MNSRERILATLSLQEPDRVPIVMRGMEPLNHLWTDPFERAVVLRDRFGIDDCLSLTYSWTFDSSVEEAIEWGSYDGRGYPLLKTRYETPAGPLTAAVFMSEDYHAERIALEADQLMPRMVERTIKDREDVQRFRYLLGDPFAADLEPLVNALRQARAFCTDQGFPLSFYIPSPSGIALKNIGPLEMVIRAADGDPMIAELLDALTDWAERWIDWGAQFEPDIISYSACYESTDFWSPVLFRGLFAPIHRRLSARAHDHGCKYIFYMTTGIDGLTLQLKGLGIGALYGFDTTPPGDADMRRLKRELGGEMAFWGGLSPTFVVERGTTEQVRQQVREHIEVLAPGGGYILCTAGSVYFEQQAGLGGARWEGVPEQSQAYRNLLTLFETGLEYGSYPIQT